jgi:hypothetical protein
MLECSNGCSKKKYGSNFVCAVKIWVNLKIINGITAARHSLKTIISDFFKYIEGVIILIRNRI